MIDVQSLTKKIDGNVIVQDVFLSGRSRRNYGLYRSERSRENDYPAYAGLRHGSHQRNGPDSGLDLRTQDAEIRRILGYQPETPPLYPFMKVRDYLRFMASMRQIPAGEQRRAMDDAIDKCKLGPMTGREIGKLSKGYRQRVGLAPGPPRLPEKSALDEPTASLDPGQINETRSIIRNCANRCRCYFSAPHIMQEVQHLCNRIVVIRQGRVRYAEQLRSTAVARDDRRSLVVRVRVRLPVWMPFSLALRVPAGDGRRAAARSTKVQQKTALTTPSAGPVGHGCALCARSTGQLPGMHRQTPVGPPPGGYRLGKTRTGPATGSTSHGSMPNCPTIDGLQNQVALPKRAPPPSLGAGIPVLGVMPMGKRTRTNSFLHYMKNWIYGFVFPAPLALSGE